MSKLYLGISFLLSIFLLSGCGGSGTSGSSGSAGADGTIKVPSGGSLALTASTTPDADNTLGEMSKTFTLSGADNLSLDSRVRYFGYLGSSSSAKDYLTDSAGTNEVTITGAGVTDAWPLDSRHKAPGNYTLTMDDNDTIGVGDGAITHLIVCPGNEAGDATSCASAALEDRGHTTAGTNLLSAAGSMASIHNMINGLHVINASATDNVTVDSITVPSLKTGALVDSGTLTNGGIETSAQAPGSLSMAMTDTYLVGVNEDNNSSVSVFSYKTSATETITNFSPTGSLVRPISDLSATEGYGSVTYVVLQSTNDNISVHSISSGSLITFNDNVSGTNDNVTGYGNPLHSGRGLATTHCSAANPNGAEVVTGNFFDNATAGLYVAKWSASAVAGTIITALDSGDNSSYGNTCAAAWVADGSSGGKLYIASADNATGYEVCVSTDNGSTCGSTIKGDHGQAGNGAHLAITTDPETYMPIVAFNKAGRVYVDRYDNTTSTWDWLIDTGASFAGTADTVSVTTSGNNHILVATQGATSDNSTVVLYYDK